MSNISGVPSGSSGIFQPTMLVDGAPIATMPAGYTPTYTYTVDQTSVTLEPSTDTLSVKVTVDKSLAEGSKFLLMVKVTAPDGSTISDQIEVPVLAPKPVYTVVLAQVS